MLDFKFKVNNKQNRFNTKREGDLIGNNKYYPCSTQEWRDSVYTFNKSTSKLIPVANNYIFNLVKSYFNMFSKSLEKSIKLLRIRKWKRRLLGRKIWISKPELKYSNQKIIINLYIYNRQYTFLLKRLLKLRANWGKVLKKTKLKKIRYYIDYNMRKIYFRDKIRRILKIFNKSTSRLDYKFYNKIELLRKKLIKLIYLNKNKYIKFNYKFKQYEYLFNKYKYKSNQNKFKSSQYKYFFNKYKNLSNQYKYKFNKYKFIFNKYKYKFKQSNNKYKIMSILENNSSIFNKNSINFITTKYYLSLIKKIFGYQMLFFNNKQMILLNRLKFKDAYLTPIIRFIQKIYKKKIDLNLVTLKKFNYDSNILTQIVTTKIRNRKNKPLKVVKSSVRKSKIYVFNKHLLKKKEKLVNKQNYVLSNYSEDISGSDDYLNYTLSSNFNLANNDIDLQTDKLSFIRNKVILGIRVQASGRITRRLIAQKATSKVRQKGSIRNIDSSYKGMSVAILKGHEKPTLQYSHSDYKRRIGAYGVKTLISVF